MAFIFLCFSVYKAGITLLLLAGNFGSKGDYEWEGLCIMFDILCFISQLFVENPLNTSLYSSSYDHSNEQKNHWRGMKMDLLCFQSLLNGAKMLINAKQVAFHTIKASESDGVVCIELI